MFLRNSSFIRWIKKVFRPISIIYDGQCDFCLRAIHVLKKFDAFGLFTFCNFHDRENIQVRFPQTKWENLDAGMIVVTEDSRIFQGFYAFRRLIWSSPWLLLLSPFFYFPGSSLIGVRLYAYVARNRMSFSCGPTACGGGVQPGDSKPESANWRPSDGSWR